MSERQKKLSEHDLEFITKTEIFMEEVYSNPDVANATVPPTLHNDVLGEIQVRKEEKAEKAREMLCDEDKELLRLGRIYKRQRKVRKYWVLAAAMVCVVAFGITSVGDSEKIFGILNWDLADREQVNVDSEDENVVPITNVAEEQVYERIEDEFGFYPVKLDYLPEGVEFLEVEISQETQNIYMLYGQEKDVNISYQIRPNYRESSWGKDVEDELVQKSEFMVNGVEIYLKQYLVKGNVERWLVGFEYKNISYSIMIMDSNQKDVEAIINGLYFP